MLRKKKKPPTNGRLPVVRMILQESYLTFICPATNRANCMKCGYTGVGAGIFKKDSVVIGIIRIHNRGICHIFIHTA
jgi:hypothetical protein